MDSGVNAINIGVTDPGGDSFYLEAE